MTSTLDPIIEDELGKWPTDEQDTIIHQFDEFTPESVGLKWEILIQAYPSLKTAESHTTIQVDMNLEGVDHKLKLDLCKKDHRKVIVRISQIEPSCEPIYVKNELKEILRSASTNCPYNITYILEDYFES